MRILFVDDEPMILKSISLCLKRDRPAWDCAYATSGEAALRELAANDFDVVVVDILMPDMDGAELLARVRTNHPRPARVVLTGHAERAIVTRARALSHAFLGKPCPVEEIIGCIERVRSVKRTTPHPPERRTPGPRSPGC